MDVLKYKTWLYEAALEARTTAVHDNMPLEDMPQNIRKIKERIRRLTDDMEQQYIRAAKNQEKENVQEIPQNEAFSRLAEK